MGVTKKKNISQSCLFQAVLLGWFLTSIRYVTIRVEKDFFKSSKVKGDTQTLPLLTLFKMGEWEKFPASFPW